MDLSAIISLMHIAGFASTRNMMVDNTYHIKFHLNDWFMILLMTAWVILFYTIWYYDQVPNGTRTIILSICAIGLLIYLIRSQIFIGHKQFLRAMVVDNSSAILMSKKIREKSNNPEIKKLADDIITTRTNELNRMAALLEK